jgi:tetratricopeptide (TPR) repeat protein
MSERSSLECERLRRDVELALSNGPDPCQVLPLLHRLARAAEDGSEACVFAHRQLAEVLLERDPWRAALHARRVTRMRPEDDRGWAALGLSQSLLGNYQYAKAALVRALDCSPDNPFYAHNLGHMLDVALDRPREAVAHLQAAYERSGRHPDIATSLAHALARAGEPQAAKLLLSRAIRKRPTPDQRALLRWLEAGAQGRAVALEGHLPLPHGSPLSPEPRTSSRPRARGETDDGTVAFRRWVAGALRRGLARLPLDQAQRLAAADLARKATLRKPPVDERAAHGIAASAAWLVITSAGIPLSQSEVAACFRVSVGTLRQHLRSVRPRVVVGR